MGSGLCRSCRGTCLSVPGCLKCVNRLGFAAIGGRNLHCRVCRREECPPGSRDALAVMEGTVEKRACSWPDKAEHQQRYPERASCRSDLQSKFGGPSSNALSLLLVYYKCCIALKKTN